MNASYRRTVRHRPTFAGSMRRHGRPMTRFGELPEVHQLTLTLPQLPPEWHGLRVAQVSDVHAGPYMPASRMQRIRDQVLRLEADLVVFTGDQLDRRPDDADRFVTGFRGLEAPLGVYGILGNHDHQAGASLATAALQDAGIVPLVNDGRPFERGSARLALVGVDDMSAAFPHRPDFSALGRYPGAYRICLCHQPRGWPEADASGAHLTLAGHTHGGQIALTRRNLNVARLQGRFIVGPYRREDSFLYVSRGVGVGAVPVRFGAPSELDLITLRSERVVAAELADEAAA